ncbi:hypothetical protein STCU_00176 [Strigomonas culicis]|uniref:Uncharacterized protein n=1 Tax=Strigomonas culicis TaxID=28005 RepID=S9U5T3_9TRYP|nr:hypothetical protein STCU_06310 [Strigomonas culicis]EPY37121.1 hypothetical protein STCU_00176 [Strigomonas culicis]|eukprot:EPY26122.1 hypothetical protein STCU_06310 [Strigomonas culicis]
MPPKTQAKKQRVRVTNKALEARQFSSVRLPQKSEVAAVKVNVDAMYRAQEPNSSVPAAPAPASGGATFDPIPNDPMFYAVENSQYWPPPTVAELQERTGVAAASADGFDTYDRRDDEKRARQARQKIVKGELNHPRGKPRQNRIVVYESSSDEDEKK